MEVRKTLQPGQQGTHRWKNKFGEKLLNVRYRYDDMRRKRYTTVEIIVEEKAYIHSPANDIVRESRERAENPDDIKQYVYIKVEYQEVVVREKVKAAGAKWDAAKRAWWINKRDVEMLGLENRIVQAS